MPLPPAEHGTANRWRTGCHCEPCTIAHNDDSRERRRQRSDEALPPRARERLLRLVRKGIPLGEATAVVDTTPQAVYARRRWDQEWADLLAKAQMRGRPRGVAHGTEAGYRHQLCRCPECRAAHHGEVS